MPRATGPAADTAAPENTPETPVAADTLADPAPTPSGYWRYVGEVPRTYVDVPVTVAPGDVIAHDGPPAGDGNWQPDPGPATRRRDNDPTDRPEEA